MDFDNRKVYRDTSITDGLVFLRTWFNMILSVAKKSRRWRWELGSLVTVQVVLEEIDSLKMCKHAKLRKF